MDIFFKPERLAVEIDGPEHSKRRDRERDEALRAKGIEVLRFSNRRALEDVVSVVDEIEAVLIARQVFRLVPSSLPEAKCPEVTFRPRG